MTVYWTETYVASSYKEGWMKTLESTLGNFVIQNI